MNINPNFKAKIVYTDKTGENRVTKEFVTDEKFDSEFIKKSQGFTPEMLTWTQMPLTTSQTAEFNTIIANAVNNSSNTQIAFPNNIGMINITDRHIYYSIAKPDYTDSDCVTFDIQV